MLYRKKMGSNKTGILKSNQKPQTGNTGAQNPKGPEDKSFRSLDKDINRR